ncbi:MAG: amidohydrolase, partial [Humibacter sp.]
MATIGLGEEAIALRRDFHQHPELGFCEFRSASIVADRLTDLGWRTRVGTDVMRADARLGVPAADELDAAYSWALERGAVEHYATLMRGGHTAVAATLEGDRPGPAIALRFDMDALPLHETESPEHRPNELGFRSALPGVMHACAHDGHMAIGLVLARLLADRDFPGTVTLFFQPAEEGGRGGRAIVAHPMLEQADVFVAIHLGIGVPSGTVAARARGLLANRKFRAQLTGRAAHAAGAPQTGRNALLGAAAATLGIQAIGSVAGSDTRVNVGRHVAGTAPNIVPADAPRDFELR